MSQRPDTRIVVVGAGQAGLLAAHFFRNLVRPGNLRVVERQASLPENHKALLRFRSEDIANVVGVPFQAVNVKKAVMGENGQLLHTSSLKMQNQYAFKVSGAVVPRSIADLSPSKRWVAPPDFVSRAAESLDIEFGASYNPFDTGRDPSEVVISTIPMPVLMNLAGETVVPSFQFRSVWVINADLIDPEVDVYQTIYYPNPSDPRYRASITGNKLIVELVGRVEGPHTVVQNTLKDFGIPFYAASESQQTEQKFGKILPIDEGVRQQFLAKMSNQHGIHCVGRFATWQQVLMDDVLTDIRSLSTSLLKQYEVMNYALA